MAPGVGRLLRGEEQIPQDHRGCIRENRRLVRVSRISRYSHFNFANTSRATAYEYSLAYVRSLPAGGPATEAAAVETIATALRLPFVFDFDPLFKLEAVVAAKQHELFSLLHIFLNDGLPQFKAWEEAHSGALQKYRPSPSFFLFPLPIPN